MAVRWLAAVGLAVLAAAGAPAAPGHAQPAGVATPAAEAAARDIAAALEFGELASIMHAEGLVHAEEIRAELFPGAGAAAWRAEAERIYAPERMTAAFLAGLAAAIGPEDGAAWIGEATGFFRSGLGQRIVGLEIAARRALLDDATEAMSRDRVELMEADGDPRLAAVDRFIAVNDLIEFNVAGGLNSHYAFYTALVEGGAFDRALTEEEILADVWGQEEVLREDNAHWLRSYLTLAYDPLTDAELDAYIAFSDSPAGRRLNRVLFATFDAMFIDISRSVGLAAARQLRGRDL
ncbi:MAG: DUF2059 domain-containing protein [Rhodobacteraceae bacterium]|jgi:hypothetical protein|nr:DUF2059 domain-containing protein [Paracoccaceae bacterium]